MRVTQPFPPPGIAIGTAHHRGARPAPVARLVSRQVSPFSVAALPDVLSDRHPAVRSPCWYGFAHRVDGRPAAPHAARGATPLLPSPQGGSPRHRAIPPAACSTVGPGPGCQGDAGGASAGLLLALTLDDPPRSQPGVQLAGVDAVELADADGGQPLLDNPAPHRVVAHRELPGNLAHREVLGPRAAIPWSAPLAQAFA